MTAGLARLPTPGMDPQPVAAVLRYLSPFDFQRSGVKIVKMGTLFGNEVVTDEIEMDLIELNEKEMERFTQWLDDRLAEALQMLTKPLTTGG